MLRSSNLAPGTLLPLGASKDNWCSHTCRTNAPPAPTSSHQRRCPELRNSARLEPTIATKNPWYQVANFYIAPMNLIHAFLLISNCDHVHRYSTKCQRHTHRYLTNVSGIYTAIRQNSAAYTHRYSTHVSRYTPRYSTRSTCTTIYTYNACLRTHFRDTYIPPNLRFSFGSCRFRRIIFVLLVCLFACRRKRNDRTRRGPMQRGAILPLPSRWPSTKRLQQHMRSTTLAPLTNCRLGSLQDQDRRP